MNEDLSRSEDPGAPSVSTEAPSIYVTDHRFCCRRSMCLRRARSLRPQRRLPCSLCFSALTCRRSGKSSAVTTCPEPEPHRTVKVWGSVRRLSGCSTPCSRLLDLLDTPEDIPFL